MPVGVGLVAVHGGPTGSAIGLQDSHTRVVASQQSPQAPYDRRKDALELEILADLLPYLTKKLRLLHGGLRLFQDICLAQEETGGRGEGVESAPVYTGRRTHEHKTSQQALGVPRVQGNIALAGSVFAARARVRLV